MLSGWLAACVVFPYSILIQNWCKMLSWLPCRSCDGFLSNSHSKFVQHALLVTLPLCGRALFNSCWNLMQTVLLAVSPLLWMFLIQFSFKVEAKCSLGCIAAPVVVSYSILIQNWCKMHSWLYCRSCGRFLIQILFKFDATCSLSCIAAPVVVSCSILIES